MLNCNAPLQTGPDQMPNCPPVSPSRTTGAEIVVIDTAIADWERLRDAAAPAAQVLAVEAAQDGLALLAQVLEARDPLSGPLTAIHLIGHGEPGIQHLGAVVLDAAALDARADLWNAIGAALGAGGALFLHGCAVGAGPAGNWLLAGLAALTGGNIAAARQPVGNGYWQLDNVHGDLPDSAAMDRLSSSGFSGQLSQKPVLNTGGKNGLTYVSGVDQIDNAIPDLMAPTSLALSGDGQFLYVSGLATDGILVFRRDTGTGELTFVSQAKNGAGGLSGLNEAPSLIMSPDGKSVYAVSFIGQSDGTNSIYMFNRDSSSGALTYLGRVQEDVDGVIGMIGPYGMAISPDGKSVYAASAFTGTLVTFNRDVASGTLTFADMLMDGVDGVEGLDRAIRVTVSPDGKSVYVLGYVDDAIAFFSRNVTTGAVTYVGSLTDNVDGVDGLDAPYGILISNDGKFVYVTGSDESAISIFSRDANTSALTYVGIVRDGENGVRGLEGASQLAITPDGKSLLVTAFISESVVVFDRNPTTGALTFVENVGEEAGLSTPHGILVSADGKHVYVAGEDNNGVSLFGISPKARATFTEDGGAVALMPDAGLTDTDSTHLTGATITLSATPDGTAERLWASSGLPGSISADYDASTRTLTLSGYASVDDYQAALRLVRYNNSSQTPTTTDRSVTITVTDSSNLSSDAATGTVSVVGVNDAPTLTTTNNTTASAVSGSGTAISLFDDTAISTMEPEQGLSRLTLTVSGVTDGTKEFLTINGSDIALTDGNSVTIDSYSYAVTLASSTATVTLVSSAAASSMAGLVDAITYKNTSNATGSRTVTITGLTDDGGTDNGGLDTASLSAATRLTLLDANPIVTAHQAGNVTYTEDGDAKAIVPAATISDEDSTNLKSVTVALTATPDGSAESLSASGLPGGITAAYDAATRTLTLSGTATVANYQEALRLVKYANSSNEPTTTARSFTIVATDTNDLSSTSVTGRLAVASANDAPTLTATANNAARTLAGSGAALSLFDDAAISTVEAGQGLSRLTLTVGGVTDGTKEFLTINGSDIALTNGNALTAGGYGYAVTLTSGTATVTVTPASSIASNAMAGLVDAITYKNTGAEGGLRTVTITGLTDDGGTVNGGQDRASLSVATNVTLMGKPVLSVPGVGEPRPVSYMEDGSATALVPNVTLSDPDSTNLKQATVTLSATPDGARESLSATGLQGGITSAYDSATRTLTLSGAGSVADYQAALRLVKYANSSNDPTTTARSYTITVTDLDDLSSSGLTGTVTVTSNNDAPTLTSTANPAAAFEASSANPSARLFSGSSISTVETGQLLTRLTLTVGGVKDGELETLTVGGQTVTLTNGASVNGAGQPTMAVALSGETATVTIEFGQGISAADLARLVDGITYTNREPTAAGSRTVTLTALRDNGGTADGGRDTASLAIATAVTIRPDRTPPEAPSITSGEVTNDASPIIAGTAEANNTIGISVAGARYNVRSDANGRWSVDLGNARPDSGTLALNTNGANTVSVTATDMAGNASPDNTQVLTVDSKAPTITGVSFLTPQMQFGATDNVGFTIGGGEAGATYRWTITSSNGATRSGSGVMTGPDVQITGIDLGGFADGPLTLSATVTDPAGNISPVSTGTGSIVKAMFWPITPPSQALVDGAKVVGSTSTRPDGTTTTKVVIEAPTAGRQEDPTTSSSITADIPIVREQVVDPQSGRLETVTTLMVGVPTGVTVTSSGPGGRSNRTRSLADLIQEIQARTDANDSARTDLSAGGTDFLSSLTTNSMLLVRSIDIGGEGGATTITGARQATNQPIALVVDSTGARGPVAVQLDNVAFAAVIGASTIVGGEGSQMVHGDNASQIMILGPGDDELHGGGGNDTVASTLGNDRLFGDEGNDVVHGGAGDDLVHGGADNDLIGGGEGNDRGFGGTGNDILFGEGGEDVLTGEAGHDTIDGGTGNDSVTGENGDDWLYGNSGNDTMSAGAGNDTGLGGDGNDVIGLGDGNDLGTGGSGNDTLSGDAGDDTLMGGAGDDLFYGGAGDDLIFADGGKDTIRGGEGRDTFALGATSGGTVIADFEVGKDRLALYDASLDLATIITTARTVDGNTLLDVGAGQIVTLIGQTGNVASWFLEPAGA